MIQLNLRTAMEQSVELLTADGKADDGSVIAGLLIEREPELDSKRAEWRQPSSTDTNRPPEI
jgi:hypothetical protein